MAHVIALFDSELELEDAEEALQKAGLNEDIVRVVDSSSRWNLEGAPIAPAAGALGGQLTTGSVLAAAFSGVRQRYGLGDEEAEFLDGALQDGGSLLILETDDPERTRVVLRDMDAQQVIVKR